MGRVRYDWQDRDYVFSWFLLLPLTGLNYAQGVNENWGIGERDLQSPLWGVIIFYYPNPTGFESKNPFGFRMGSFL